MILSALASLRGACRTARTHGSTALHPLLMLARGLKRLSVSGSTRFRNMPRERRGPALVAVLALLALLYFVPYGPTGAAVALFCVALWVGRERAALPPAADLAPEPGTRRLTALHHALVPHFAHPDDPAPLYTPTGEHHDVFEDWSFDEQGQLTHLDLHYPALFTDGEPESRARVERTIRGKAGRARDYHFVWDEEHNRLHVTALPPLPEDITVQRFVTNADEVVLGFTDRTTTERTIPISRHGTTEHAAPLTWRPGPRAAEPHLLVLGAPGSGKSNLVRAVALQALTHGDLVIIDGAGTGDFACLAGRPGVVAVETTPQGVHDVLEWTAKETQRRLALISQAKHAGRRPPAEARRPLWVLFDSPTELAEVADAEGQADPQTHLEAPLRHGRPARVTVVVADELARYGALSSTVRAHARARVLLGAAEPDEARMVFGGEGHATERARAGRGWARVSGEYARLQVPLTPDPLDEDTPEDERRAVLALLPAAPQAGEDEDTPAHGVPTHASMRDNNASAGSVPC